MPKINFTKATIENLPKPDKGWKYYQDEKTPALSVGIGPSGVRTFILYKRINDKPERVKLGRFPEMTIEQARKKAMELHGQIAAGENPADLKREKRNEMTLKELFDLYIERYARPHEIRTIDDMCRNFDVYLGKLDAPRKKHGREPVKPPGSVDWSNLKVSTITHQDVSKFHRELGMKTGKSIANRMVELLRATFNRCKDDLKVIDLPNPAAGIKPFQEVERDRYLQSDEIPKLFAALADESEQNRDYYLLSLLTAARKSNVLSMRWCDLNLVDGRWRISSADSKNKKAMYIPLTKVALEILERRKRSATSEFVFPGTGRTGHMTSPKAAWKRIVTTAGLNDVRPHDLRRSLGSWMVNTGSSLALIGGALGHKDPQSTKIYARLAIDPIKDAMEKAQSAIFDLIATEQSQANEAEESS
jgi:integrase